ncbi:hypothetical protein OROHE_014630 [Orobanche hederae]
MKKDKGVAVENPSRNPEEEEDERVGGEFFDHRNEIGLSAALPFSTRNASSKYDFVKVKVWLGDNADHYYVLSRFLLSRMLTVTKIPNHVAIKIALELKKLLIDNSLLDVSQSDLEANLFKLMERRGYGEEYINRYKMMTRFHHQRVPLVILVCGTACVGKSTIATQLAQRLNLPNVLQTDMVYELLRTATDAPLTSSPVWARDFSSSEELITEFCRECRIVRKGLAGDLKKAMKDGKPIIIERLDEHDVLFSQIQTDIEAMKSSLLQGQVDMASIHASIQKEQAAAAEFRRLVLGWMQEHERRPGEDRSGSSGSVLPPSTSPPPPNSPAPPPTSTPVTNPISPKPQPLGFNFDIPNPIPPLDSNWIPPQSSVIPWATKKVKLPEFHGFDPQGWLQKAILYFEINGGIHLDPSIYLMDDENKLSTSTPAKEEEKYLRKNKNGSSVENDCTAPCTNQDSDISCPQISRSGETITHVDLISADLNSKDIRDIKHDCTGEMAKDADPIKPPAVNKIKSGPEPIIIPIILKMADFDHKALLEEWLSTRSSEKYPIQDKDKLIGNLKTIQDYLCSFKSQGYTVVNLSATAFPQTLDWLHNYLLQAASSKEHHLLPHRVVIKQWEIRPQTDPSFWQIQSRYALKTSLVYLDETS